MNDSITTNFFFLSSNLQWQMNWRDFILSNENNESIFFKKRSNFNKNREFIVELIPISTREKFFISDNCSVWLFVLSADAQRGKWTFSTLTKFLFRRWFWFSLHHWRALGNRSIDWLLLYQNRARKLIEG